MYAWSRLRNDSSVEIHTPSRFGIQPGAQERQRGLGPGLVSLDALVASMLARCFVEFRVSGKGKQQRLCNVNIR